MLIAGRNGMLVKRDVLPSWLRRVKYLESSGTQYIDTGLKFSRNQLITFEFECISNEIVQFGANAASFEVLFPWLRDSGRCYFGGTYFNYDATKGGPFTIGRRYRIVLDSTDGAQSCTINNILINSTTKTGANRQPIWLMASRVTNLDYRTVRVFGFACDELVLVPVAFTNEQSQDEGAMYDLRGVGGMNPDGSARNDGLYRNRGTGSFIIGPDV